MAMLHGAVAGIALDDFGKLAFSSFAYLTICL